MSNKKIPPRWSLAMTCSAALSNDACKNLRMRQCFEVFPEFITQTITLKYTQAVKPLVPELLKLPVYKLCNLENFYLRWSSLDVSLLESDDLITDSICKWLRATELQRCKNKWLSLCTLLKKLAFIQISKYRQKLLITNHVHFYEGTCYWHYTYLRGGIMVYSTVHFLAPLECISQGWANLFNRRVIDRKTKTSASHKISL